MPLGWNEIKDRARRFSREWAEEASEDAEAKSEHESRGKDLDRAHGQARDYFHGLAGAELPKYLFERYQALTSLLPAKKPERTRRTRSPEFASG